MHPLLDLFEETVARRGRHVAVSDAALTLDYRAFRAVAAGLSRRIAGGTSLERVGIMAPASSACAAALFGAWYAGKTPIPINFLSPAAELGAVVADARIDLILTIERFVPTIEQLGLETLVLEAESLAPGDASPPQETPETTPVRTPEKTPEDTCVILYTSGTSGQPKGVCLSFANIIENARASVAHMSMTCDQVFLSVLPPFHSFGLSTLTVLPLTLGATVHHLPRFSPVAIIDAIEKNRVSVFVAVASMFGALAQLKRARPDALKSLQRTISGGEALPAIVAETFERKFGVKILEGYGLTETSPVAAVNSPTEQRTGSVGRPIPGVRVRAVDEQGRQVPDGADGELIISGHCVMQGYFNRPEETAAAIRDGWLHTGDIGRIDADGYVYITGRAKEMLIIGGENVYPREIESVLERHEAVAEAAVIGVRDDVRGELPVAFVILQEGATADETELRGFCRRDLAGYKVPRQIKIAADLPRGPTGKILKRALRERLS